MKLDNIIRLNMIRNNVEFTKKVFYFHYIFFSLFNVAVNKENQHVFILTVADNVFMLLVIYQKFRIVDSDESCHESCHVLCHIVMTS